MEKTCKDCLQIKPIEDFSIRNKKTGLRRNECKECCSKYLKEYNTKNQERIKSLHKTYYEEHHAEILANSREYSKAYYKINKSIIKTKREIFKEENYEKLLEDQRKRYKIRVDNDPEFKLKIYFSSYIRQSLKANNSSKFGQSFITYFNYDCLELKKHLERQFESWMTWENWGIYDPKTWNDHDSSTWTWQIDHIIPQSDLPYSSMEDDNFKKCWALNNLRPLSAKQNNFDGVNRTRHQQNKVNK